MQQTKRHHYVPKAYLKAFCDDQGKLRVYRKDNPTEPLHQVPDATQFRKYYYSQPIPDGGQDNNTLEAAFSSVEAHWPETVAELHARGEVNDRLENIFQFIALQRVRVPASRDAAESMLAQTVKDTMKVMLANGKMPSPPPGLEDLPNQMQVAIDPHRSIHSMVAMLDGMGKLFSLVGFAAVHNNTGLPFITSDNPVLWFDPSLPSMNNVRTPSSRVGLCSLCFRSARSLRSSARRSTGSFSESTACSIATCQPRAWFTPSTARSAASLTKPSSPRKLDGMS